MFRRAYSTFEIKSVDDDQRVIEGVVSTPTPDRDGDVMEPSGAKFTLPHPFLYLHRQDQPIGHVIAASVTPDGIQIRAQVAKGVLPRIEEAWALIKSGLVRGLSVGWKPIEASRIPGTMGLRVNSWHWLETSAVTIPANQDATITRIKQLAEPPAASGTRGAVVVYTPGVTGTARSQGRTMATYAEQITHNENSRAAKVARMNDLMTKAGETGSTLDESQAQEYETLKLEVKAIDDNLVRLRDMESLMRTQAVPIAPTPTTAIAVTHPTTSTTAFPVVKVTSTLPKGTPFVRYAMALCVAQGNKMQALEYAKRWQDTPEVELAFKAAIAAGTALDATFAGPLVVTNPLAGEFLELLRPRTLVGRVPGLRQVPFNVSVPSQTAGGTYGWVGENKPKPLTNAAFATQTMRYAKAAGIIVLTEELVRMSNPSAEALIREEMIAGIAQFLDLQFIDPAIAAVANVNPASITNGAPSTPASGTTESAARTDLRALVQAQVAANIPLEGSVFLMSESTAFTLGTMVNAVGGTAFPGLSATGGSMLGVPVVTSNTVGNRIILVHAPSIMVADDGGTNVDVSREASVQMDSAPDDPGTATTVLISLWQRNLVGLRAERWITWLRARTGSVRLITGVAYA